MPTMNAFEQYLRNPGVLLRCRIEQLEQIEVDLRRKIQETEDEIFTLKHERDSLKKTDPERSRVAANKITEVEKRKKQLVGQLNKAKEQ